MKIENSVVLVTGANRGIGLAFARALLVRGARKVYAAARNPASVTLPGVDAMRLDFSKADEIAAAAQQASEVTLVINNAGIAQPGGFLAQDSEAVARRIFETSFFSVLRMSKAVAPVLKANGGGALLSEKDWRHSTRSTCPKPTEYKPSNSIHQKDNHVIHSVYDIFHAIKQSCRHVAAHP